MKRRIKIPKRQTSTGEEKESCEMEPTKELKRTITGGKKWNTQKVVVCVCYSVFGRMIASKPLKQPFVYDCKTLLVRLEGLVERSLTIRQNHHSNEKKKKDQSRKNGHRSYRFFQLFFSLFRKHSQNRRNVGFFCRTLHPHLLTHVYNTN